MGILTKIERVARQLRMFLIVAVALSSAAVPSAAAESPLYSYGKACKKALPFYRQGWAEILEKGRWTEAERLYREAVAVAPDCVIAKSVLGRITVDAAERKSLITQIQASMENVDPHGRLILEPYLKTLILISARDTAQSLSEDFRGDLTKAAISNYQIFLEHYPEEWAVRVEYIEWIHAEQGPQMALEAIQKMSQERPGDGARFSYFPAYFHAELGAYEQATELARQFVQGLGPGDWPQEHYINAFIAYQLGDYSAASQSVKQALVLDPRHLIAERLSKKIDAAMAP
ncbi:hypothetical protein R0135_14740 [Congregibacter variabilis]|uniref:Tetratricopeptide repeat protein n=1 Tax=Congregibacter variabilis TaxID=3081200 RepID=A0ABZ0I1K4_9GAMM|nr:hypothetical protein R0135_14740 [Congregibacter sp. IMCC43200]